MKHRKWIECAYLATSKTLQLCYNQLNIDGWSENYITTRLLESIGNLGLEIDWEDKPQRVKWEGFKLKGKAENQYGDIALLVRVWLTGDRYIDGVAFYEAKRQYFNENNVPVGFTSIKQEQLSRIQSKTHASSILLYDIDRTKETAVATAVPTIFVEQLEKSNLARSSCRLLHHYGEPWVKSLSNNFIGLSLDFRQGAVDSIRDMVKSTIKPSFILNASVGMTQLLEPKLDDSFKESEFYENWIKIEVPTTKADETPEDEEPDFRMK
jgi:hypothetical protein